MKPILASLLAMIAGWGLPVVAMAIGQLINAGRTSDVVFSAFWTGLFALLGWAVVVVPLVECLGRTKALSDLRFSWFTWSILGMLVYCVLVVSWTGREMLIVIWYPALVGSIAGFVFACLVRRGRSALGGHSPLAP